MFLNLYFIVSIKDRNVTQIEIFLQSGKASQNNIMIWYLSQLEMLLSPGGGGGGGGIFLVDVQLRLCWKGNRL